MEDASDHPPASFNNRMVASFLDSILFLVLLAPLVAFLNPVVLQDPQMSLDMLRELSEQQTISGVFSVAMREGILQHWVVNNAIQFIVVGCVVIPFWRMHGATPGKMLLRMRVVDAATGENPTLTQCLVRFFGYIVATLPLFLGFIWIAFDKRKRGWHDLMAGTEVRIYPRKKWYENPLA